MIIQLENKETKRFYEIFGYAYVDKTTGKDNEVYVTIKFGKIGKEGYTKFKKFDNRLSLSEFVKNKIKELWVRGYNVKYSDV